MKYIVANFDMIANDRDSIHHDWTGPPDGGVLDAGGFLVIDQGCRTLELEDAVLLQTGGIIWKEFWIQAKDIHFYPMHWAKAAWRPGDLDDTGEYIDIDPERLHCDKDVSGPVMFCDTTVATYNYGHFVQDFLPYGTLFRTIQKFVPTISPLITPMTLDSQDKIMESVFGISKDRFLTRGTITKVKRLFVPQRQTVFDSYPWRTSFSGLRTARERATSGMGAEAAEHISKVVRPVKVFLHRTQDVVALRAKGTLWGRDFTNVLELVGRMADSGYLVFEPAALDIETTAKLLARAETVVGIHGANLANIIFCPPGTRIIEIRPSTGVWRNYQAIGRILGHDFHPVIQPVAANGMPPVLDVEELSRLL